MKQNLRLQITRKFYIKYNSYHHHYYYHLYIYIYYPTTSTHIGPNLTLSSPILQMGLVQFNNPKEIDRHIHSLLVDCLSTFSLASLFLINHGPSSETNERDREKNQTSGGIHNPNWNCCVQRPCCCGGGGGKDATASKQSGSSRLLERNQLVLVILIQQLGFSRLFVSCLLFLSLPISTWLESLFH